MAGRTITVRGEGILLDQLLAIEFGPVLARGLVVPTLELNRGLADAGAVLPRGSVVTLPDRPAATQVARRPVVSLFG